MKALNLKVTGSVQGVFFRAKTQAKAKELGLTGWVRNCEDGSVEIHAQGDEEAFKQLEEWCQHGPEAAKVEDVKKEEAKVEDCSGFEVRC